MELKNPSPVLQGRTERLDQFKQDVAACSTFDVFRDMLVGQESSFAVCPARESLDLVSPVMPDDTWYQGLSHALEQ